MIQRDPKRMRTYPGCQPTSRFFFSFLILESPVLFHPIRGPILFQERTSGSRVRPTLALFHLDTTSLVVVLESELFKSLHDTRQKIKEYLTLTREPRRLLERQ